MKAKILYAELGMGKKLNEIVMIGTHDAGITEGTGNVRTQSLNIGEQAVEGVRIFDIRITGALSGKTDDGKRTGELATFHGMGIGRNPGKLVDSRTKLKQPMNVQPMSKGMGAYGETLDKILDQAHDFVSDNGTEFLILKFDKCDNWQMIANACIQKLGDKIYRGRGNINKKTLKELAGSVVVVFGPDGLKAISSFAKVGGILGFKNLYPSKGKPAQVYSDDYDGIQYVGKGGTDIGIFGLGNFRGFKGKMKENIKKQTKIFDYGAGLDNPDVLGMMYWTTTGWFKSIQKRDNFLWNSTNRKTMSKMLKDRMPLNVDINRGSSAGTMKTYMPNFVMVDFAEGTKCAKIFKLNFMSGMVAQKIVLEEEEDGDDGSYYDL